MAEETIFSRPSSTKTCQKQASWGPSNPHPSGTSSSEARLAASKAPPLSEHARTHADLALQRHSPPAAPHSAARGSPAPSPAPPIPEPGPAPPGCREAAGRHASHSPSPAGRAEGRALAGCREGAAGWEQSRSSASAPRTSQAPVTSGL